MMKIRSLMISFLILFIPFSIFAQSASVEIKPAGPVKDQLFHLLVKIQYDSTDGEPYVSFRPKGIEVLGRKKIMERVGSKLVNGKIRTTKDIIYDYEMITSKAGNLGIYNIIVETPNKIIRIPNEKFKVLKTRARPKTQFVHVEVSKTSVYVGEGIDVRYYLYSKHHIRKYDVKQFPKFNKFIKRFYFTKEKPEKVKYMGEVFSRQLVYSARIYPEKVGKAVIDPFRLSLPRAGKSAIGIQSIPVKVQVMPLPAKNVPKNFTGLVGQHTFKLILSKTVYQINAPIEMKLIVDGVGALENYESPILYRDDGLEEFDTKNEIERTSDFSAKKIFEYTYLARKSIKFKRRTITLSYLDPVTSSYVARKLKIPALITDITVPVNNNHVQDVISGSEKMEAKQSIKAIPIIRGVIAPVFTITTYMKSWTRELNAGLVIIFLLLLFNIIISRRKKYSYDVRIQELCRRIRKKGLCYSTIHKLIFSLSSNSDENMQISLHDILKRSSLTDEAKKYFERLVEQSEKVSYNNWNGLEKFTYQKKYFNELLEYSKIER